MTGRVDAYLVANAKYHDTDFARLELLKLLAEDTDVRVRVAEDFSDTAAIGAADFLVTYTCDVRPAPEQEEALRAFVERGGRWVALHATNALLDFTPQGISCPRTCDTFMETLGSRFISHPPIQPYRVTVSNPAHPLVAGIEAFEASDELYLCEYSPGVVPLLETRFTGSFPFRGGYVEHDFPEDTPRLVAYTHRVGAGEVFYLTLGHCCGKYDMQPLRDETAVVRGSWELPVFYELLRRAIAWAKEPPAPEKR